MARGTLVFIMTGAMLATAGLAAAQTGGTPPAPAAADPKAAKAAALAAAQKAYATGTKAFEAGKFKDCIPQLTTALGGGGLPSAQMAKALYYRGVANRKIGKPAQAMSDLTTAIWVSGGLSDAERAAAIENRQAAYREAGLGDQAPSDFTPEPVQSAASIAPAPSAAASAPVVASTPAAAPVAFPPATVEVAAPPLPAAVPSPSPPVEVAMAAPVPAVETPAAKPARTESTGIPSPFDDLSSSARAAAPVAAAPSPPEPAPPAADPSGPTMLDKAGKSISDAGSNVGSFFKNMFGGGSSSTEAAATAPGLAQGASPAPLPAESQTSSSPVLTAANPDGAADAGWGGATAVKSAGKTVSPPPAAAPVSTAAITTPAAAASAPKKPGGKYLLQIGAVRSRADADALALKVTGEHGAALGGREPVIDEAVIGNFGSFHRVRVGPYADAKEPGKLCGTLIKSGFDCLVVTQ